MFLNQKNEVQEGMPPMSHIGKLVTTYKEKTEELNIFTSIFSDKCSPHSPQMYVLLEGDQGSNIPPNVSEDPVHGHLRN